jgi:hypothetical protein
VGLGADGTVGTDYVLLGFISTLTREDIVPAQYYAARWHPEGCWDAAVLQCAGSLSDSPAIRNSLSQISMIDIR